MLFINRQLLELLHVKQQVENEPDEPFIQYLFSELKAGKIAYDTSDKIKQLVAQRVKDIDLHDVTSVEIQAPISTTQANDYLTARLLNFTNQRYVQTWFGVAMHSINQTRLLRNKSKEKLLNPFQLMKNTRIRDFSWTVVKQVSLLILILFGLNQIMKLGSSHIVDFKSGLYDHTGYAILFDQLVGVSLLILLMQFFAFEQVGKFIRLGKLLMTSYIGLLIIKQLDILTISQRSALIGDLSLAFIVFVVMVFLLVCAHTLHAIDDEYKSFEWETRTIYETDDKCDVLGQSTQQCVRGHKVNQQSSLVVPYFSIFDLSDKIPQEQIIFYEHVK